jgi:preprotein translocase subunit SecD
MSYASFGFAGDGITIYEVVVDGGKVIKHSDGSDVRVAIKPFLRDHHIKFIEILDFNGGKAVQVSFTKEGGEINLAELTRLRGSKIAFVIMGKAVSVPIVITPSSDETIISGDFDEDGLRKMFPGRIHN